MDATLLARLLPGLAIKIQRSNGLIHSANVMTVNLERSSVSVEWAEGGSTKGKEIDFEDVAAINPELLQLSPLPVHPKDSLPLQENVTVQKQKRRSTLSKIPAPKEALRGRSTRMSAISETQRLMAQENDMEVDPSTAANTRSQFTIPTGLPRAPRVGMSELPLATVNEAAEEQTSSIRGNSAANPANSVRRKSCLVKEMEKMKTKREEKRAQNSEMRIKRAQEYDTSMPNWEFARMIKEFRATLDCHRLTMTDPIEEHRICVCVRKRPLNKQELAKKEFDVISVPSKCLLLVHEPKLKVDLTKYLENQAFRFDFAFDETASNEVVYRFTARPLVQTIFEGGKATCFAYGQTGSGKTHTMGGDFSGKNQNASKGIYAFASRDVFLLKNQPRYKNLGLEVYVTFFEIYNGKLFDLLNKKAKLRVLEDGKQQVQVVGLQEHLVNSADDVIRMIETGSACRTSGQTFANASSSRSHACFQILLRAKGKLHGKFSLVDLAGNERGADTSSADRQTRMEGAEINKSLLALKECIRALGQNKSHTPFRESKLTQVLRDSFIGENSRTCMAKLAIACILGSQSSLVCSLLPPQPISAPPVLKTPLCPLPEGLLSDPPGVPEKRILVGLKVLWETGAVRLPRKIAMISPGMNSCEYTLNTLRYADRVKELSPHNSGNGELQTQMETEGEELGPNSDSDRQAHRLSTDEEELSSQMSSFQEAMTQIGELEEKAIEELKEIVQKWTNWVELLETTEQPDYDLETFVNKAQHAATEGIKNFSSLQDVLRALRLAMQLEEQASQQMSSHKRPQ